MTTQTKSGGRTVACSITHEQHEKLSRQAQAFGLRSVGSYMRYLLEESMQDKEVAAKVRKFEAAEAKPAAAATKAPAAKATKAPAKAASPTSK
jgi:hypothetical protein